MKKLLSSFLILAMLLAVAGCASSPPSDPGKPGEPGGERPVSEETVHAEALSGPVSLSAMVDKKAAPETLSPDDPAFRAVGDLGKELLLASDGENPVISPLSVWIALAMAAEGADGATAEEFRTLLGGDAETLEKAAAALEKNLRDGNDEENIFSTANSAWVDDKSEIRKSYLEALVSAFGADVFSANLPSKETLDAVNAWVSEKTRGLIPSMLGDPLPPETALVLINTLYMKAKWAFPFDFEGTWDQEFRPAGKDAVTVPFMHSVRYTPFFEDKDFTGVVLPYRNGAEYIALKPLGIGAEELLKSLSGEKIASLSSSAAERKVSLALPKLESECTVDMTPVLPSLGISSAFDQEEADFSRMGFGADGANLYLGKVLQKVKIIVDEEGTEAAAATMIAVSGATAVEEQPVEMTFDEPFVYLIVEPETGVPLFMGIVTDPS